ncbi:SET and MYND domain-containing protein 4 [Orussus abietinus]|uniref:SET and MYND domain-containing protein 4 n=1 Tax=Orussus abietinus TaxID=222816 RepID=UPI0006251C4D|nr:SET and MYND domain-containing protein 4 [Orussus abietinus]
MEDSAEFYRRLCSSETLCSGRKGFFHDFCEVVVQEVGEKWIDEVFAKHETDEDRFRGIFKDPRSRSVLVDPLERIKELYRDKDAEISRSKRLEGLLASSLGNHEKALHLLSMAVLRAPITGKNKSVDGGYTYPLALLARATTLMDLKDRDLALQDLELVAEEDIPEELRRQLGRKLADCNRETDARLPQGSAPHLDGNPGTRTRGWPGVEAGEATRRRHERAQGRTIPPLKGGANPTLSGSSRLVEVRETPGAGRHAVAAEEIHPGDTLATEPPLAACLLPDFYGTHCQHCFSRLRAPLGCPECSSVAFCGEKCRKTALESYHKYECKIIALLIGSGISVLSMVALRMVTQTGPKKCLKMHRKILSKEPKSDPLVAESSSEPKLSKSARRRLRKKKLKESETPTMDHLPEEDEHLTKDVDIRAYDLVTLSRQRSPKDFLQRTVMAAFLTRCLQKVGFLESPSTPFEPSPEEVAVGSLLLRNLQLLQFNAHEIYETRIASEHRFRGSRPVYLGVAIYPSVALFNHDCYPAVTRYFVGRDIVIRATRSLNVGDAVAENYGPIFTKRSLQERQRSLFGRYWFRCACTACTENWPLLKDMSNASARIRCPTQGCPKLLARPRDPKKILKCPGCQKKVCLEEVENKLRECETAYESGLSKMDAERPEDAIRELAEALKNFHRIAAPPHKGTHLAEIALAACMANSGNTWTIGS